MRSEHIRYPVPRLLSQKLAAAYLGLSDRAFEGYWRQGIVPKPHRLGRRVPWDRKLLDQYVDELSQLERDEMPTNQGW